MDYLLWLAIGALYLLGSKTDAPAESDPGFVGPPSPRDAYPNVNPPRPVASGTDGAPPSSFGGDVANPRDITVTINPDALAKNPEALRLAVERLGVTAFVFRHWSGDEAACTLTGPDFAGDLERLNVSNDFILGAYQSQA